MIENNFVRMYSVLTRMIDFKIGTQYSPIYNFYNTISHNCLWLFNRIVVLHNVLSNESSQLFKKKY